MRQEKFPVAAVAFIISVVVCQHETGGVRVGSCFGLQKYQMKQKTAGATKAPEPKPKEQEEEKPKETTPAEKTRVQQKDEEPCMGDGSVSADATEVQQRDDEPCRGKDSALDTIVKKIKDWLYDTFCMGPERYQRLEKFFNGYTIEGKERLGRARHPDTIKTVDPWFQPLITSQYNIKVTPDFFKGEYLGIHKRNRTEGEFPGDTTSINQKVFEWCERLKTQSTCISLDRFAVELVWPWLKK